LRFFVEPTSVSNGEEDIKTAKIDWAGEADHLRAEHLVAAQTDKPKALKRNRAKQLLLELLAKGSVAATIITEKTKEAGIRDRTLNYAKKELGIESYREGEVWYWKLPEKKQ
jgi:hypothetical protein